MAERSLKALCNGLIPEGFSLPEGRLLLAFSGGEDSLFLMSLLSLIAPRRSAALYVNHGIRSGAELEREEAINAHNASLLGIPLVIKRIPEGDIKRLAKEGNIGIEAAARELRYGILRSYARDNGFDRILTAHHMDDQAETVLMRLLSGSPIYRLEGIKRENGRICRPFLSVEKELINSYIKEEGLEYSSDSTNTDTSYKRNFIRLNILPHLKKIDNDVHSVSCNINPVVKIGIKICSHISRRRDLSHHVASRSIYSTLISQVISLLYNNIYRYIFFDTAILL